MHNNVGVRPSKYVMDEEPEMWFPTALLPARLLCFLVFLFPVARVSRVSAEWLSESWRMRVDGVYKGKTT